MPWTTDPLDVLTEREAKAATVGDTQNVTQWDTSLSLAVTAISRLLDDKCGAIVNRAVTGERHNGGSPSILLNWRAASAIASVVEYVGTTPVTLTAETLGTAPGTGFLAEIDPRDPSLYTGRIFRRYGGLDGAFPPGRGNVVVTYTAGRYATTDAVDSRFKRGAAMMLANYWRGISVGVGSIPTVDGYDVPQAGFPTFSVPNAVKELLRDDWREAVALA